MFAATRLSTSTFLLASRVAPTVLRRCPTMSATERAVYLEDLEGPIQVKQAAKVVSKNRSEVQHTDGATSSKSQTNLVDGEKKAAPKTSVKRQRNIMDMFSGTSPSDAPAAKKRKEAAATSAPAVSTASALTSQPSLNSIPFSLSDFESAMSDEERKLLALECETLGKSWYVWPVT